MSTPAKTPRPRPARPAAPAAPASTRLERTEPAPVSPQNYSLLCTLTGHLWQPGTSAGGQWTFHRCTREGCGQLVDIKPAA